MPAWLRSLAGSGVVHVAFAFLAMGGWAVFANRAHAMPRPVLAGLVQGTMSAILTLCLKTTIDALSHRFSGVSSFWAPPAIACILSTGLLVAVHTISGTPEILRTILVPVIVSATYSALYSYSIYRRGKP